MLRNKKNKLYEIISPVEGTLINLEDVKDEMFSKKLLGDGVAIIPSSNEIVAPIDGHITMIASTKHAFGIENDTIEILVHIGIDTVCLDGVGFTNLLNPGVYVKKGTPVIEIDKDSIENKGYDTTVMIISVKAPKDISFLTEHKLIKGGDIIGTYK